MIDTVSIILGLSIWLFYFIIVNLKNKYLNENNLPNGPSFIYWFINYLFNYYGSSKTATNISIYDDDDNYIKDNDLIDRGSEQTVLKWFKQYNTDSYCVSFFGLPMIFTRDPVLSHSVLVGDSDNYEKPPDSSGVLIRLARDGILMAEGERWQRHRDILAVPFSSTNVRKMESTIATTTDQLIERIKHDSEIDAHSLMTSLTYDIIGLLSISHRFSDDGSTSNFDFILNEMIRPIRRLSRYIPLPSDRKLNHLIKELELLIINEIKNRNQQIKQQQQQDLTIENKDLLDYLLNSDRELTEDEIIGNIMTFLLAGHETSANALTFTLYLLAKHTKIQDELYRELLKNKDNYHAVPLLEWVILETLRLFPPAPMIGRSTKSNHIINQWKLPPKSMILISVYAMHRNESIWENAHSFIPNRWSNINSNSSNHNYLPFSSGPRVCLGQKFSITESKIIISKLLLNYKFTWNEKYPFEIYQRATLTPKNKVILNITKR